VFTPASETDLVTAVIVQGRYSVPGSEFEVVVDLYLEGMDAPLSREKLQLQAAAGREFLLVMPVQGSASPWGGSLVGGPVSVRVHAQVPMTVTEESPAIVDHVDIRIVCLEGMVLSDPTDRTTPNPLDADADGDGWTLRGQDCDDADADRHPLHPEVADGKDNDCNGLVDDGIPMTWYWRDADSDGFGQRTDPVSSSVPLEGYVTNNRDCDDGDASVNPEAEEIADGKDNDCDGQVDETSDTQIWYLDLDGDGDGGSSVIPPGYGGVTVQNGFDCDDYDAAVYLGAPEIPDGKDNDCDGQVDE
jgi:hypothetical protein